MRDAKRLGVLLCAAFCAVLWLSMSAMAQEAGCAFVNRPEVIRTGQPLTVTASVTEACEGSLSLIHRESGGIYALIAGQAMLPGENAFTWEGLLPFGAELPMGAYTLRLETSAGGLAEAETTVGEPFPYLQYVELSGEVLTDDGDISVSFHASEPGTLHMRVLRTSDDTVIGETRYDALAGENTVVWDGTVDGVRVPHGEYGLLLSLEDAQGETSALSHALIEARETTTQLLSFDTLTANLINSQQSSISRPYGTVQDDSFWGMPPGETDDAATWDVLTQPITVYDDGKITSMGHVYLRENPDGSGAATAQIHGLSQGLHVIGEPNEYGQVLVEAFSNYDPDYHPQTPEERYYAFDLCQGYLPAEHLKTVQADQHMALLIDKLTQRMYLFVDGKRETEFIISTGKITDEKYYYETIPGEFMTIGHGEGFWSGSLYTAMLIRFNGGTMIHEVPHMVAGDGSKYYGIYETRLGQKHSSGCVRVPYKENEEGYNMAWLYQNLSSSKHYKVLIWDDRNRSDRPATWR